MNEQIKQLFNECIENVQNGSDFGSITYHVYCGDCIEFDFFDHMIRLMCDSGDTKINVSYYNRPNMRVNYSHVVDFDIELIDTCTYSECRIMVYFKYRNVTYRLVYDFDDHNMIVQLIDDENGEVFDFDDDYTDDFSIIYHNVVTEYDDNVKCIEKYRNE